MIASSIRLVWLTLFAFSVQFCVVAFHHHSSREVIARSMVSYAGHCVQTRSKPCAPSNNNNPGCALLCWGTAVAATSLVPSLFDFPVPFEIAFVQLQAPLGTQGCGVRCYELRARGPPLAQAV